MTNGADTTTTRHLHIIGRVQGVGFRYWMQGAAQVLGVAGWVRNCSDGSVEAMVQGEEAAVMALVQQAHQGPRGARVEQVDVQPGQGQFDGFVVVATQ